MAFQPLAVVSFAGLVAGDRLRLGGRRQAVSSLSPLLSAETAETPSWNLQNPEERQRVSLSGDASPPGSKPVAHASSVAG